MTCLIRTWATGKWSYLLQAVSRITWKKYPTDLRSGYSVKECPNPEQIPRSGMNSNVSWRLRGLRSSKVWFRMLYSIRSRPCFFRHTAGRWDKDEKKQRRDLDKERREILFWIQTPCNYGLWLRSDTKWNKMSAWITGWYSFSRNPGIRNWFIHHSLIIYLVQIQRRKGGLPSMEQNTPPTLKQKLHSLAAFLPIFEQQDFIFGTWVKQKKGSPAFLRCHISVSPAMPMFFFSRPMTSGGFWETSTGHSGNLHQKRQGCVMTPLNWPLPPRISYSSLSPPWSGRTGSEMESLRMRLNPVFWRKYAEGLPSSMPKWMMRKHDKWRIPFCSVRPDMVGCADDMSHEHTRESQLTRAAHRGIERCPCLCVSEPAFFWISSHPTRPPHLCHTIHLIFQLSFKTYNKLKMYI